MLIIIADKQYKLVCPCCGGSNIGNSGLGEKYVHCFGYCMADIPKDSCGMSEALPEEIQAFSQEEY